MQLLQTTTLAAQTIVNPLLIATYTTTDHCEIIVNVRLSGVAGAGTYRACMTRQRVDADAFYQSPTSAAGIAAGVTTLWLPSMNLAIRSEEVVRIYVQGLAADTSVATVCEIFDVTAAGPTAADVAAAVWTYATRTLTSFGTLVADIWSYATRTLTSVSVIVGDIAAAVWAYVTRTLTMTACEIADTVTECAWTKTRGSTWEIDTTLNVDLSGLTANDEIWWTLKSRPGTQEDDEAILQISLSTGLLRVNGVAASDPTKGSITIVTPATGAVQLYVSEEITTLLQLANVLYWDFALFIDGSPDNKEYIGEGTLKVSREVTRAITK